MKKIVAIDMDGVLADFHKSAIQIIEREYNIKVKPEQERTTWEMEYWFNASYEKMRNIFNELMCERKGFWRLLPVIEGAYLEFERIYETYETYIITAPIWRSKYCMNEKVEWINFNFPFVNINKHLIMSKQKHVINADVLIEDKLLNVINFTEVSLQRKGLLLDYPFNRSEQTNDRITRLKSWNDIKLYL